MNYALVSIKTDSLICLVLKQLAMQTAIISGTILLFICQLNIFSLIVCLKYLLSLKQFTGFYDFLKGRRVCRGSVSVVFNNTNCCSYCSYLYFFKGILFNPNESTQNLTAIGAATLFQFCSEKWCKQTTGSEALLPLKSILNLEVEI